MSTNQPVDPRVRLAISTWPDDAPSGTVSSFCAEHGISRNVFYKILNRARTQGPSAALEPRSRRPRTSPSTIPDATREHALQTRAALERSGLDHGPISVHETMRRMGLATPSEASLARIFRQEGVSRNEPKKKPRASYRRFVYPAPNCLWQLDAAEYVLTRGRKCVIFQLEDDHSRTQTAIHVARTETADDALIVFQKGIARYGVPQKLLTDNGTALNPSRRGWEGKLVVYASSLGVEAITGRPGKPTTQGKNERFHQTLFRWLDQQPLAESIAELQTQCDRFDVIYNTQRPHQGLPGRMTPREAWDATPVAPPPRPPGTPPVGGIPRVGDGAAGVPGGEATAQVQSNGGVSIDKVFYYLARWMIGETIHAVWDQTMMMLFDERGDLLVEYEIPRNGVRHVSSGRRPRRGHGAD